MSKIAARLREIIGNDAATALMRSELAGRSIRVPVDRSNRQELVRQALDARLSYAEAGKVAGVSRRTACRYGKL